MAEYTTQVIIPVDTAVGTDAVVNNWHMSDNGLVGPTLTTKIESWHEALKVFYNSIREIFTDDINHAALRFKTYDLDQAMPRQPVVDQLKSITAPSSNTPLPHELCIVLSYNSTFQSGVNSARRRGRVFLGPLSSGVMATGTGDARVDESYRSMIATAAGVLRTGPTPDQGWFWRTRSSFAAANGTPNVVNGYVDDAFDIQRSRGTKATAKTTF